MTKETYALILPGTWTFFEMLPSPVASKIISTHYGGNSNDMTTDWNYTPFFAYFLLVKTAERDIFEMLEVQNM